jgi:O-antigen/teichoic acid export membrane protein
MLNAANRAAEVAKIGLTSSGITIALTFILTPMFYIEGAAVAMLVGSIASLAMSMISLKSKENIALSAKSTLKPSIAMMIGAASAFATTIVTPNIVLSLVAGLATYGVVSIAWRVTTKKEVRTLLGIMRKSR